MLLTIGIILLISSVVRLGMIIKKDFSGGELIANFPMYSIGIGSSRITATMLSDIVIINFT